MHSANGKAIISVPLKLIRNIEKARQRRQEKIKKFYQRYGVDKRTSPVIISCRDPKLNHYEGQRYPTDGLLLATENWKKPKQDGDYFAIINSRCNADDIRREKCPFDTLSSCLSKPVLKAVEEMGLLNMTLIQRKAIEPLAAGINAFVGAEAGSGKTIAYLAPVMERLIQLRRTCGEPAAGCPRALILSPTRELNQQLLVVSKKFVAHTCVDAAAIRRGADNVYTTELDHPGYDLLVASVSAALRYRDMGALKFDHIRHVIVDEADAMLNEQRRSDLFQLLHSIKLNKTPGSCEPGTAQLVLVASLYPDDLDKLMTPLLAEGAMLHVTDDRLHWLQSRVRHRFIRMDKKFAPEALLKLVKEDYANKKRVVVFTRDPATCEWVQQFLTQSGVAVVALHDGMSGGARSCSFQKIVDGDFIVMVATDTAALGLDTVHLEHVINYQLPYTIGEYLKRAGRLRRHGGPNRRSAVVTTFVTNRWQVNFVQDLEQSVRLNQSLSVNDIVRDRLEYEE